MVSDGTWDDVSFSVGIPQIGWSYNYITSKSIPWETPKVVDLKGTTMDIIKVIEFEEGFRNKPYLCSEGFVTVGYGTKIHKDKGLAPEDFLLSVDRMTAGVWLQEELDKVAEAILRSAKYGPIYQGMNPDRQAIVLNMGYQLGVTGLFNFKRMWIAFDEGDYVKAAKEALDSRWAKQTPERAKRVAMVIETGNIIYVYGE